MCEHRRDRFACSGRVVPSEHLFGDTSAILLGWSEDSLVRIKRGFAV